MDIKNTQHYTTNADKIIGNLIDKIPENVKIIEPFVGKGDLIPFIELKTDNYEIYDIDSPLCPSTDTLLNPPDYKGCYVITNPPYMAKNKATDKHIYNLYNLDDLYKIAIQSLINGGAEGGILIIPINFFTDENTEKLRTEFLNKYYVKQINYFDYKVFDETAYSICSFYFDKKPDKFTDLYVNNKNDFTFYRIPTLKGRLFSEFYKSLEIKPIVSRVVPNNIDKATNIKVYCIDNKNTFIRAEYDENIFVGKNTDRVFFTMTQPKGYNLSIEEQHELIKLFNDFIKENREKYHNLIFTNYRENNRKRIGFDTAYKIFTNLILTNLKK